MNDHDPLTTAQQDTDAADEGLTPAQTEEIEARLRSLGYIE